MAIFKLDRRIKEREVKLFREALKKDVKYLHERLLRDTVKPGSVLWKGFCEKSSQNSQERTYGWSVFSTFTRKFGTRVNDSPYINKVILTVLRKAKTFLVRIFSGTDSKVSTQKTFISSNSTIETLEKGVKPVQNLQ